jgi:hypothetical protein
MIEESITRLAVAVEKLCEQLARGTTTAAPVAPAPEKSAPKTKTKTSTNTTADAPAPTPAPAEAEEVGYTVDGMRDALKALLTARGMDMTRAALAAVGATKLADVKPSDYAKLDAAIRERMTTEADPFG